ncbi:MAG TPA: DUF5318 family protein, partial [Nakamurella sp.]|nr:DUF5318 family protein [Nakamurella sp.]
MTGGPAHSADTPEGGQGGLGGPRVALRRPAYPFRVRTQRGLVDYALQRRALLASVRSGRTGVTEVCDASPYLVRAAKF